MSTAELERPSPTGTAARHVVSARLQPLRPVEPPCGQEPFDDLAVVFPSRRLGCTAATALARRRALGFDARASATAWLIGEGLEALDPDGGSDVMEGWSAYRDHGPRLVGDGGCDVRLGRGAVGAAERAALLAWLPLTERELAVYEGGLFEDAPAHAIALLAAPADDLGRSTRRSTPSGCSRAGRRFAPERFAAIEHHAYGRIRAEHLIRLRRAVARIAAQLPVARAPGRERDRRLGLRARRRRRRPRAERSSPASSRDTPRAPSSERAFANPGVDGGKLLLLWSAVRASSVCACAPSQCVRK